MEEIKVGEYVRTDKGKIGKVMSEYGSSISIVFNCERWEVRKDKENKEIIKHSPRLIDLIEKRRLCKWRKSGNH